MSILLSTFEEQKLLESIPDEILESIKDQFEDELVSSIQLELEQAESDNQNLREQLDNITYACLQYAIEKHLLTLKKPKRRKFTLTVLEIIALCPALEDQYINFHGKINHCFNDVSYTLIEDNHKKTFTIKE